jgi:hypothetical protein
MFVSISICIWLLLRDNVERLQDMSRQVDAFVEEISGCGGAAIDAVQDIFPISTRTRRQRDRVRQRQTEREREE